MAERKVLPYPVTASVKSQPLRQVTWGWIITVGCPGVSFCFIAEDMEQRISWGALGYCCQWEGKGRDLTLGLLLTPQEQVCIAAVLSTLHRKGFVRVSLSCCHCWKEGGRCVNITPVTCKSPSKALIFCAALDSAWGWSRVGAQRAVLQCPSPGSLCPVLPSFPSQSLADSEAQPSRAGRVALLSEGCFYLLMVCFEEEECDQGNMLNTGRKQGQLSWTLLCPWAWPQFFIHLLQIKSLIFHCLFPSCCSEVFLCSPGTVWCVASLCSGGSCLSCTSLQEHAAFQQGLCAPRPAESSLPWAHFQMSSSRDFLCVLQKRILSIFLRSRL